MLLFAVLLSKIMMGQVVVNLQLPAIGLSVKSQLWNMTISNTSTEPMSIKITLILTDIRTGQQVLSGSTGILNLPPGNNFFQYGDILPISYVVLNNNYMVDASPEGFLPPGNYNICYEVLRISELTESMAEECSDVLVESLSPPYLTQPDDLSEIEELKPVFAWLPPTPEYLLNGLSYNFKLVEILPNQTCSDAIGQNFPLVSEQNLLMPNLIYPTSQSPLDTGRTYAWQVVANNNGLPVSESEIWTFKVKSGATLSLTENKAPFVKLKTDQVPSAFICSGVLQLEYNNELNDSLIGIEIFEEGTNGRRKLGLDESFIPLRFGQNLISIDLTSNNGIVDGHQYTVELMNSKMELWRGRFIYKPNN